MRIVVRWLGIAAVFICVSCGTDADREGTQPLAPTPSAPLPATGTERYVIVGFWNDPACAGPPVNMNRFPVHYGDTQCYTWPGRSGENSASRFSCGRESFSYTQWTTLTCSGGQNPPGTRKTHTMTECTQDFPPTLYGRILDFSGCAATGP